MSLEQIRPASGDDELSLTLFERYCVGEATPQELATLERWFQQHPGQQVWYEELRSKLRAGTFPGVSQADQDRGANAIMQYARGEGPRNLPAREMEQESKNMVTNCYRCSPTPFRNDTHKRGDSLGLAVVTRFVRTMFGEVTSWALALIHGAGAEIKEAELERLRDLISQTDREKE